MTSFLSSIGKKKKPHEQVVISAKQAIQALIDSATQKEEEEKIQLLDTVGKSLSDMRSIVCGTTDNPDVNEEKATELSKCFQAEGLPTLLVSSLDRLTVESRKDTVSLFSQLLKRNYGGFVEYLTENSALTDSLLRGYSGEAALTCGSIIRECLRYEALASSIQSSEHVWDFFTTYVHIPNFDTASDAFNTLKDLLTMPKHRHLAEAFMQKNCDKLLEKYDILLQSENYVTRRRSLKLLAEILLDRSNYPVMMRYISSKHNLKTMMNLLRNKSPQIQLEAFHVFKIFVANPSKTPEIESTLFKNRVKLIAYLQSFHTENDDPQFVDERRLLIDTLQQLTEPPASIDGSGNSSQHATAALAAVASGPPAEVGAEAAGTAQPVTTQETSASDGTSDASGSASGSGSSLAALAAAGSRGESSLVRDLQGVTLGDATPSGTTAGSTGESRPAVSAV